MRLHRLNEEVFFAKNEIVKADKKDIKFLKKKAARNSRRRSRICLHKDTEDRLHEMLIVHTKDAYIRPHKHFKKSESLYVIEGSADAVIFDDNGEITETIHLGDYNSGKTFYYRISKPLYHTLLIKTKTFIFHEVTNGPFNRVYTTFAEWSPAEDDTKGAACFMKKLARDIDIS